MREIKQKGLCGGRFLQFPALPSTNQWILDNVSRCAHGDVIRALSQTAGRGRFQREWISPEDRNLTVSVALDERKLGPRLRLHVTQAAAIAVRNTLARYAIPARLKWPNDVLAAGRKIAGVLAEQESASNLLALGIGLNVNLTEEDLRETALLQRATSMHMLLERQFDTGRVLASLLAELERVIGRLARTGSSYLAHAWRRSDALLNRRIAIQTPQGILRGRYSGIDEEGRLMLEDRQGRTHPFLSGDVSICK